MSEDQSIESSQLRSHSRLSSSMFNIPRSNLITSSLSQIQPAQNQPPSSSTMQSYQQAQQVQQQQQHQQLRNNRSCESDNSVTMNLDDSSVEVSFFLNKQT